MIMKKETLEKRIVNLIKKYAPRGTTFEWSRTTTCFGDCSYEYNRSTKRYSNFIIRISYPFASINEWNITKSFVLHEIAHALTPGHNHDDLWRQACLSIGGDGVCRFLIDVDGGDVISPKSKWLGVCPVCGKKLERMRLTKDERKRFFCCDVDRKLVWIKRH